MKIEDGKRLVEITARVWSNGQYSQDLSVGLLIDDSFEYGYLHNYTSQELSSYQKEAYADLKELKRQLREYPGSVIKEDPTTERFVLAYPNS